MVQDRADLPMFGGRNFHGIHVFQMSIDPPNIPAQTTLDLTVAVPTIPVPTWDGGLTPVVVVTRPNNVPVGVGIVGTRYISTTSIGIAFGNFTIAGIDPPISIYTIAVIW